MNYTTNSDKPCAFITKAKQRLKQFGQRVYLANNSEFELEIFNPTSTTVLAKINLNGTPISNSGIIIKPGERVFLDRFLDTPKKFKFETYEVDSNNEQVQKAIAKNGEVIIYFYNEKPPAAPNVVLSQTLNWLRPKPECYFSNNLNDTGSVTMDSFISTNSLTPRYSTSSLLTPRYSTSSLKRLNNKSTKETGTIEKGSDSQQTFTYSNKEFLDSTTIASIWFILPESEKLYESTDLKIYCTQCGTKRKRDSHKFCPNCGSKY
jgi:hypothetical protein